MQVFSANNWQNVFQINVYRKNPKITKLYFNNSNSLINQVIKGEAKQETIG